MLLQTTRPREGTFTPATLRARVRALTAHAFDYLFLAAAAWTLWEHFGG